MLVSLFGGGAEPSVSAHATVPFGQHVLEKAAQKLSGAESAGARFAAL